MSTITLNLSDELADRLRNEGLRLGLTLEEYVKVLLLEIIRDADRERIAAK